MNWSHNILVSGVGGQGSLVCSRVLAKAAVMAGYNPIIGETFGASRRGGTVFTHIRIGNQDRGPLIPRGAADTLLGLEPIETLRAAIKYAGPKTNVIVSVEAVVPEPLPDGISYPDVNDILNALASFCKSVHPASPSVLFNKMGTQRTLNSYMLGLLAGLNIIPLKADNIRNALISAVKDASMNIIAFDAGLGEATGLSRVE